MEIDTIPCLQTRAYSIYFKYLANELNNNVSGGVLGLNKKDIIQVDIFSIVAECDSLEDIQRKL